MNSRSLQRTARVAFGLTLVAAPSACRNGPLSKLSYGISRDSVLTIFAGGSLTTNDSMPHVYREAQYFVDGKTYSVLFYTTTEKKQKTDSTPPEKLTPIVLESAKLIGAGAKYWDSLSVALKISAEQK